jgi:seryl-tRNA synthetase
MATDHWPWDAFIPVGAALGGYLVKAVQDGLTRRHEDRRRFSSDLAKHSARYLDHVIEWRLVIEEVMRLMNERDLVTEEIDQAVVQTPDAPHRPRWVEEDKRINVAYDACVERSREHETQCRDALSVLTMVASPQVVRTAQALFKAADKNVDEWDASRLAFVAAVRRTLGVQGDVTA